jgi:hypothetical protein
MKAIVIIAWPNDCWNHAAILSWYSDLERRMDTTQVAMLWLDSSLSQDRRKVVNAIGDRFQAPVLMDYSQTISRSFGLAKAGDVIVISPDPWKIVAKSHWSAPGVETLLSSWMNKKSSSLISSVFVGAAKWATENIRSCDLPFLEQKNYVWNAEMAHRFMNTCGNCHLQNASTDFFKTTQDIFNWSQMNRTVVRNYRMPPGGSDYNRDVSQCASYNDYRAEEDDLRALLNWFEQKPPRADTTEDLVVQLRSSTLEKTKELNRQYAKPDLIWEMPKAQEIPATGESRYEFVQMAGPLDRDLEITALGLDANMTVGPHVQVFASREPLPKRKVVSPFEFAGNKMFEAKGEYGFFVSDRILARFLFTDGLLQRFPGTSNLAPKGSYIIISTHYVPTGKVEKNRIRLKVFLNQSKQQLRHLNSLVARAEAFTVPSQTKHFEVSQEIPIPKDISIIGVLDHMHNHGVAGRFELLLPDGQSKSICNVPFRKANREISATMNPPVFVPKGSVLKARCDFENTSHSKPVPSGPDMVKDEMCVMAVSFVEGQL